MSPVSVYVGFTSHVSSQIIFARSFIYGIFVGEGWLDDLMISWVLPTNKDRRITSRDLVNLANVISFNDIGASMVVDVFVVLKGFWKVVGW